MRGRRRSRAPLRSGGSGRKPQHSYCHYTSLDLFVNTQHAHGNLKPPTHHPRRLHRTQTPRHLPRTPLPPLHHQPHPTPTHNPPTDLQKEAATSPLTAHTTPRKETKKKGRSWCFSPFHSPRPWPNGDADAYAPPAPGAAAHQPSPAPRPATR